VVLEVGFTPAVVITIATGLGAIVLLVLLLRVRPSVGAGSMRSVSATLGVPRSIEG
jgi:hypothetical protein